jgi:hypothetical protein
MTKWTQYFEPYHTHFSRFRGKEVHIVEIGVQSGGSLEMWKNVLGENAYVYGIDIDPLAQVLVDNRTKFFIGDQTNRTFWASFREAVPHVDIIIDDGGHEFDQMKITLAEMLPHVSRNGVYLIEDINSDTNSMWRYFKDEFMSGHLAHLTASMHIYPYLVVLELSPLEQNVFLLPSPERVGSRSILHSLDWSRSALCSNERHSQRDRRLLESFSHSLHSLQIQRLPWPCFGHLVDLPAGAALLLPYSNDPGAMLKDALTHYDYFHHGSVGSGLGGFWVPNRDQANDSSWIFVDVPSVSQNLLDSMHLYPKFLLLKRHETGCVRNISATFTGKKWIYPSNSESSDSHSNITGSSRGSP